MQIYPWTCFWISPTLSPPPLPSELSSPLVVPVWKCTKRLIYLDYKPGTFPTWTETQCPHCPGGGLIPFTNDRNLMTLYFSLMLTHVQECYPTHLCAWQTVCPVQSHNQYTPRSNGEFLIVLGQTKNRFSCIWYSRHDKLCHRKFWMFPCEQVDQINRPCAFKTALAIIIHTYHMSTGVVPNPIHPHTLTPPGHWYHLFYMLCHRHNPHYCRLWKYSSCPEDN